MIIMKALQLLTLIALIAAAGCSTVTRRTHAVIFEVRPVSIGPAEGYTPMTMLGTSRLYYVGNQVLLSNADIATAIGLDDHVSALPPRGYIELTCKETSTAKFISMSKEYEGKRLAFILDQQLYAAPVMPVCTNGEFIIRPFSLLYTDAVRIAAGIAVQ